MNFRTFLRGCLAPAAISLPLVMLPGCDARVSPRDDRELQHRPAVPDLILAAEEGRCGQSESDFLGLEATVTILMAERPGSMYFASGDGARGGPFRIPAGRTVGLHIVNNGERAHGFVIGRRLANRATGRHGYEVNLLWSVGADLFLLPSGRQVGTSAGEFHEIEVAPGADLWIRAYFPAAVKGEWEMGCFMHEPDEESHHDQGMKARVIIE